MYDIWRLALSPGPSQLLHAYVEKDWGVWEQGYVASIHYLIKQLLTVTVCHAAINAILNKNAENLSGCTLYTTLFPSHEDAKMVIQAGIRHVVYYEDKHHDKAFSVIARKLFMKAKVLYTWYDNNQC